MKKIEWKSAGLCLAACGVFFGIIALLTLLPQGHILRQGIAISFLGMIASIGAFSFVVLTPAMQTIQRRFKQKYKV